jgi:hypothetical protein
MVTDLGEQPTPEIEPAEPPPGGVDAIADSQYVEPPVVPDLTQVGNEGSKDALPEELTEELTEPDRPEQGASSDGASEPESEAPA